MPFSSKNKTQTTVVKYPGADFVRVFVKGAPEILIKGCKQMVSINGELTPIDKLKKNQILNQVIDRFAKKCYRTIMMTYVDLPTTEF